MGDCAKTRMDRVRKDSYLIVVFMTLLACASFVFVLYLSDKGFANFALISTMMVTLMSVISCTFLILSRVRFKTKKFFESVWIVNVASSTLMFFLALFNALIFDQVIKPASVDELDQAGYRIVALHALADPSLATKITLALRGGQLSELEYHQIVQKNRVHSDAKAIILSRFGLDTKSNLKTKL
jgi:hypothetical protein